MMIFLKLLFAFVLSFAVCGIATFVPVSLCAGVVYLISGTSFLWAPLTMWGVVTCAGALAVTLKLYQDETGLF